MLNCHLKVKTCRKWENGLNLYDSANNRTIIIGLVCPHPGQYTCIFYNNIQTYSSLKPLGQSKPSFIGSIYGNGEPMYVSIIQVA